MKHNKHVVVAMLVAPILALLAYFGAGHLFGEKPQAAVEGGNYRLAEKPNCRWDSGRCGLRNADFEMEFSVGKREEGRITLRLESAFPLDGVMLALVEESGEDKEPAPMRAVGSDGRNWTIEIETPEPGRDRLRLATAAGGASYYGEASTEFVRQQESPDSG